MTNAYGTDTAAMTDLISVTGVAPAAAFSGVPTRGDVPLTVQFTDESTTASSAISAWAWDFGDGGTSSEQHPSHEYTGVGTFSISLTVTNAYGADTSARTDYITVAGVSPQASFTSDITSGESPVTVQVASMENADLGATVIVPVTVDEAEGLTGLDLTFSYPYGEVALESVEAGSLTTDFTRSENQGDGFVRVSMSNPTPLAAGGGTLVELTFTVARTVAPGSVIPIKLNEAELKGQFGGSYRWYTDILKLDGTITVSAGAGEGEGATEGVGEGTGEGTTEGIGEGAGEGDDGGTGPGCAAAGLEGPGTHDALGDLMLLAVLGAGLLASGRGRRVDAKSMRYGKTRGIEAASPFN